MSSQPVAHEAGDGDVDPRKARSRARLIDAATALLASGGIEAVTIDAVTRASKVARTTLYRHFGNSTQLLLAAFERLVPRVTPAPATGTLRERMAQLLDNQAALIEEAPVQLTLLTWLALGSPAGPGEASRHSESPPDAKSSLRAQVVSQYREPFDELLQSQEAQAELGELNVDLALAQLVGPVIFAKLIDLPSLGPDARAQLIDDFFTARARSHRNRSEKAK
jgi:TetR/AcrR family transcriptional regulator of autoinduction and epiphytic fitness